MALIRLVGIVSIIGVLFSVIPANAKSFVQPYIGGKFIVGTSEIHVGSYQNQSEGDAYPIRWGGGFVIGAKYNIPLIAVRTEVEYLFKRSAKTFSSAEQESKLSLDTHGLMANIYADLTIIPIFKPYISAGLGAGFNELKFVPGSIEFANGKTLQTNFIWQTGIGFYTLLGPVALDLNLRYVYNGELSGSYYSEATRVSRDFSASPHTFEALVSILIFL